MGKRWMIVVGALVLAGCGASPPGDLEAGGGSDTAVERVADVELQAGTTTVGTVPEGTAVPGEPAAGALADESPTTVTSASSPTTVAPTSTTSIVVTTTQPAPTTTIAAPTTTVDTRVQPRPYTGTLTADEQDVRARVEQLAGHPLVLEVTLMDHSNPAPPWEWRRMAVGNALSTVELVWPSLHSQLVGMAAEATHLGVDTRMDGSTLRITVTLAKWA